MELRHIQAFIAVAEELSLRKAGRRLGVSQASVSRQVQQLEQELGLALFVRRRDGIELSYQGTVMLDQAMHLAGAAAQFTDHLRTVESHKRGVVRLGMAWGVWDAVNRIRAQHAARVSGVAVLGDDMPSAAQADALRQRRIDVGVIRPPVDMRELRCETLYEEGVVAVLPADHPLAGRQSVRLAELAAERLLLHDRDLAPSIYDKIFELYSAAGVTPLIVATSATPASPGGMIHVASGKGIWVGLGTLLKLKDAPGIAVVPLDEPRAAVPVCILWRAAESSPIILQFVESARESFGADPVKPSHKTQSRGAIHLASRPRRGRTRRGRRP